MPDTPPLDAGLTAVPLCSSTRLRPLSRAPLVTILTVVRNGVERLEETIQSVLRHKTADVEYIVVDGGSTDGTVDLIRRYHKHIDHWSSESDSGVYDAMNKGHNLAAGTFLLHLNVGDALICLPLEALAKAASSGVDVLSCAVQLDNGTIHRPETGSKLKITNTLHHQGTFYRTSLPLTYNTTYAAFADFDLNQRLWGSGRRIEVDWTVVASHSADGLSHNEKHFAEVFRVIRNNFGMLYVGLSFFYFKWKGLRQWMRNRGS